MQFVSEQSVLCERSTKRRSEDCGDVDHYKFNHQGPTALINELKTYLNREFEIDEHF